MKKGRVGKHMEGEDGVKAVVRVSEGGEDCGLAQIAAKTGLATRCVMSHLRSLTSERYVQMLDGVVKLTATGHERAVGLVRAHRLWDSYLAAEPGTDPGAIPAFDPLRAGGEAHRLWQQVVERSRMVVRSYDALMVAADIESETPGSLVRLPPVSPGPQPEGRGL